LYEDEEDEIAKSPVVPSDDPQFKALEKDMDERNKRAAEKSKRANQLKEEGNAKFSKGDLNGALALYDEAMEFDKMNKSLWNNKSLILFKLGQYQESLNVCDRILEYCEIFEDGFKKSAAECSKALYRRGLAKRELRLFKESLEDLEAAFALNSSSNDIASQVKIGQGLLPKEEVEDNILSRFLQDPPAIENDLIRFLNTGAKKLTFNVFADFCQETIGAVATTIRSKKDIEPHSNRRFISCLRVLIVWLDFEEALGSLLLTKVYNLIDCLNFAHEVIAVLAKISVLPLAQSEIRTNLLRPCSATQLEYILGKISSSLDALVLVSNILYGSNDSHKSKLTSYPGFLDQVISILTKSNDSDFVDKVSTLICNAGFVESLIEPTWNCFLRTSNSSLENALHNLLVLSKTTNHNLPNLPKFLKLFSDRPSLVNKQFFSILQRLPINEETAHEALGISMRILGDISQSVDFRDAALKFIAVLFTKDSSILNLRLANILVDCMCQFKPHKYSTDKTSEGLFRGNLCLMLGQVADRQIFGGLLEVDLRRCIEAVILTLRMDVEGAQRNAGIALSKIGRIEKYKDTIRELKGFESLAQIQLKLK
jgi:tetratricopeptide (TPR) repeat protein